VLLWWNWCLTEINLSNTCSMTMIKLNTQWSCTNIFSYLSCVCVCVCACAHVFMYTERAKRQREVHFDQFLTHDISWLGKHWFPCPQSQSVYKLPTVKVLLLAMQCRIPTYWNLTAHSGSSNDNVSNVHGKTGSTGCRGGCHGYSGREREVRIVAKNLFKV